MGHILCARISVNGAADVEMLQRMHDDPFKKLSHPCLVTRSFLRSLFF